MQILTFLYALALLALGVAGFTRANSAEEMRALASPGLFFGGAVLLCAFFAIREPRHGLAGASFLAFLAGLTSAGPLFKELPLGNPAGRSHEWLLTGGLFAASLVYLGVAFFTWRRARRERFRSELHQGP